MSTHAVRINLSAAQFPLISGFGARTIILPQQDMNFQKSAIFAGADQDRDVGIPQIFYGQNIIPTGQGFQSVGFHQQLDGISGNTDFDQCLTLLQSTLNHFLFVPAAGKNFVYDAPVGEWVSIDPITGLKDGVLVTSAFIEGETYVYYSEVGCFKYNETTKAFDEVTLTGLVPEDLHGIVGSNGYLLAWDATTIYWSSAVTPTDFTPSLLTGAGSAAVTDIKGRIICCLPTSNGFIIYGSGNAVGASFTGNLQYPFSFKEIIGSGGIRSKEHVSYENNADDHYALTSVGLQQISRTTSKMIFAEAADFLTNRIFEDYDSITGLFTTTYLQSDLYIKIAIIDSRYLVISYGVTNDLTHALIFDILQKRWGKVKIDHRDCFPYTYPNLYGEITYQMLEDAGILYSDLIDTSYEDLNENIVSAVLPRRTVAFLQKDGTVKLLDFDLGQLDNEGVLLVGKFQWTRGHSLQLLGINCENVIEEGSFEVKVLPTFDGKNFGAAQTPYLLKDDGLVRNYLHDSIAYNHTILFLGDFNLVGCEIKCRPAGRIQLTR